MTSEENFTLSWKIKNFSLWHGKNSESIKSPEFIIGCLENSKWCLLFNSKSNLSHKFTGFAWQKVTSCSQNVEMSGSLEIVDISDEIIGSRIFESLLSEDLPKQVWFLEKNYIFSKLNNCPGDTIIVRCHLRKINKNENLYHSLCKAETNFVTKKQVAIWNIKQYFVTKLKVTEFSLLKPPLKLNFKTDSDPVFIDIQVIDTNLVEPFHVKATISLLDVMKLEQKSKFDSHAYLNLTSDVWCFPYFISKEEMYTTEYIKLTFIMPTGEVEHRIKDYTIQDITKEFRSSAEMPISLLSDLRDMHNNKKSTYLKLKVNEELIDVHKFILTARSPVFCSMLEQDKLENNSGIVNITALDVDIVKMLVEYMYTDSVAIEDFELSLKLLMAAHKYQILSLVDKCAFFLKSTLDVNNILEIVKAADLIGHEFLKRAAIDFIIVNVKTILVKPTWIPWIKSNVGLCSEIICEQSRKIEEISSRF